MELKKYVIKRQFLQTHRYEALLKHTFQYQDIFRSWLSQIAQNYRGFGKPHRITQTMSKDNLNSLIFPFMNKIQEISNQHLEYIASIMRQSASMHVEKDTHALVSKVQQLNQTQTGFETTYRDLLSLENRISMEPNNLEAFYYYNWFKKFNALEQYGKAAKAIIEAKPDKAKIYQMSEELETELLDFRKKIINHKYGYLKHGVKMSRQLLKCLSEYLTIGLQILSKINGKLKLESAARISSASGFRESISSKNDHLMNFHEEQQIKSEEFKSAVSNIQNIFSVSRSREDKKVLFSKMIQMYNGNEHLLEEMIDTYNIFELLGDKRKKMYDKLNDIFQVIERDQKQRKRQIDVIHPLTKTKSLQQPRSSFNYQTNYQTIENYLSQAIQFSLKYFSQLNQMCYKLSTKVTEARITENNMSISYQYKEVKIKNKKLTNHEIWLWKDWREFREFQEVVPKFEQAAIQTKMELIRGLISQEETNDSISCVFQGRGKASYKAGLNINQERIRIKSKKDSSLHIIIPYQNIEYVEPDKNALILKLNGGVQIRLSEMKNLTDVETKINSYFLENKGGAQIKATAAPAIVPKITDQEIQAINKRQNQMKELRPTTNGFTKFGETKIKDLTMPELYDNIFSEKRSCTLSNTQSFSEYFNLRQGNLNFKATNYDKSGPFYYTGTDKEVTFVNTPLTSSRTTEFEHPLPPIPFFPKTILCKTKETMYWVSDKELDFLAVTSSFGHKMMEAIDTITLYKIVGDDEGVRIEVSCKIEFKESVSMRSIIEKSAIGEIKKFVPQLVKEMERCLKLAIRARKSNQLGSQGSQGEKMTEQEHSVSAENVKKQQKSELSNLTTKTIAMLVLGTIVVNIIIHLILF